MTDGIIDIEGFEKYGPIGVASTFGTIGTFFNQGGNIYSQPNPGLTGLGQTQGLLQAGWTFTPSSGTNNVIAVVTGLAGRGKAIGWYDASGQDQSMTKNLEANYARMLVGFAFGTTLGNSVGVALRDGGTTQVSVWVDSGGHINVGRGDYANTLYTSGALFTANTRHYVELDVTIDPSAGAYQLWLDGVSLTSAASQNTRSTANSYVNQLSLIIRNGAMAGWDDMYWGDNTGGTMAPLGDATIEALRPTADSSVQFSPAATALGFYRQQINSTNATGANTIVMLPFTPEVNCTLNSLSILPRSTNAAIKIRGGVYSDSAGAPGSLLSDGTEVVGILSGATTTLPLVTPQALTGGVQYWLAILPDTSFTLQRSDIWSGAGRYKPSTPYSSAMPAGPMSGMSTDDTYAVWGNATGAAANWVNEDLGGTLATAPLSGLPPVAIGYNQDGTVGHEDLFDMEDLSAQPSTIVTVKVSAMLSKDLPGTRTADVRAKSGTTDAAGSASGFAVIVTPAWYSTRFDLDPNTAAAWTLSSINSMKAGYKVAS